MTDQRRSARIASEFWVRIKGVDECLVLRRGDISVSGIYVEAEQPIGPLGSIQQLRLASADKQRTITVMARLLRAVMIDDLRQGLVMLGAALEFLPTSPVQVMALEHLVRQVETLQLDQEIDIEVEPGAGGGAGRAGASTLSPAAAAPGPSTSSPAAVAPGAVELILETSAAVRLGEEVVLRLLRGASMVGGAGAAGGAAAAGRAAAASPVTLRAVVAAVEPLAGQGPVPRHRAQLTGTGGEVGAVGDTGLTPALERELDALFEDWVAGQETVETTYPREHLTGQLSRIALTSLLGLFEMDRMTGELHLSHEGVEATVAIKEGLLAAIDGEVEGATVRRRLRDLMGWSEGHFEFLVKDPAGMPRGAGLGITGMLLNAAVDADEGSR